MDGNSFWVEEFNDQLPFSNSLKRKRNVKIKKLEFVGWGSKPLIEFLQSIGKDTDRTHSQQDVTAIVTAYVNSNNLLNPQRKKKVMCDERLQALFGKKSIPRMKIYDLLEPHFSENHDDSEDEHSNSSEEEDILIASKARKTAVSPMKKVPAVPKSCFAAVIANNIKLVYLKRSLVQELLKTPENIEDKIVGSFVRVKSDPNDYFQKNSHQLQQVEGVRKVSAVASEASCEFHLQLSNLMKGIPVSSLSDDDFSEEECEDLRERIKAGLLKRPTVLELELKAQVLHKDITKHWIEREIALLQRRIDHANEKGWRKQLFEYLEKKKLLQTTKEQDRLFSTMPNVIAEELEPEVKTADTPEENEEEEEKGNGSPNSRLNGATDKSGADIGAPSNRIFANGDAYIADGNDQGEHAVSIQFGADQVEPAGTIQFDADQGQHAEVSQEQRDATVSVKAERSEATQVVASGKDSVTREIKSQVTQTEVIQIKSQVTQTEVIELSDDDDVEDQKDEKQATTYVNPGVASWHYLDPQGNVQGPFPLTLLKHWSDACYFEPSFRVWKFGQRPEEATLLIDVLRQFFPIK